MHGEDFRRVVADWLSSELPELLERDVQLPVDSGNVVAVVGPRRAGKTSLMLLTVRRLLEAGEGAGGGGSPLNLHPNSLSVQYPSG
ncbi:MAG: hypothetical protein ACP5ID_01825 [Conexivisphaera sp.]